ncbi:MAG: hypothetical protein Q8M40_09905, partial [Legionella sp.]|nr:hypothetical protein [Legionella sp.]
MSQSDLKMLKVLIVNLNKEHDPLWICLHKCDNEGKKWIAYSPEIIKNTPVSELITSRLSKFTANNLHVTYEPVDYKDNELQNDIAGINDVLTWHSVLISRVLPFCLSKDKDKDKDKDKGIKNYRDKIPLSLLIEYAFKSTIRSSITGADTINKGFARRAPFSNRNLTEFIRLDKKESVPNAQYLLDNISIFDSNDR